MPKCPCCAEKLLRHVRHGEIYWFCSHCWQEMPDLASRMVDRSKKSFSNRGNDRGYSAVKNLAVKPTSNSFTTADRNLLVGPFDQLLDDSRSGKISGGAEWFYEFAPQPPIPGDFKSSKVPRNGGFRGLSEMPLLNDS